MPNPSDSSPEEPLPPTRPPFNEVSVLFPLLTLYTVGYLGLMVANFVLRGALPLPAGLMPIYIALTGAYAADKEVRRWAGTPEPARKGSFFVYLWFLFFLTAFTIRTFRPEFSIPEELGKVVLQVLGIFFGSRTSKYFCEARSPKEDPALVNQRELKILEMLKTRRRIRNADVTAEFGISATSARKILSGMIAKGMIRRVGERKATYYEAVSTAKADRLINGL